MIESIDCSNFGAIRLSAVAPSCIGNHRLVAMTTFSLIRLFIFTVQAVVLQCKLKKNAKAYIKIITYKFCEQVLQYCDLAIYNRISSLVYTMQFCKQRCYTNTRKHLQLALKCILKDFFKVAFFLKMNNKPPMKVLTLCEENSGSTNYSQKPIWIRISANSQLRIFIQKNGISSSHQ